MKRQDSVIGQTCFKVIKNLCKVTPFCVSFHPKLQNINTILRLELEVLKNNPTTKYILENRIIVAFRKGRNLKDILVRSDIERKDKLEPGSFPCKAKCKICKYITPTKSVESRDKSYYFKIKSHLSCCSTSLIYMISCKKMWYSIYRTNWKQFERKNVWPFQRYC